MSSISFVIPVKNDAARLAVCLRSIKCQAIDDTLEVVVVDNGSTDASVAVAEEAGARVLKVPSGKVSQLRNTGANETSGELIAFVDADHELCPGWLDALEQLAAERTAGAFGALYLAPESGTWVQTMYEALRGRSRGREVTDWLGSGNLVVRKVAFERVGGFDETLEACEDVDLCRRLRKANYTVIADERLGSIHYGDPPTLRALFRAERWRGRDNVRVALRGPFTFREAVSLAVPLLILIALVVVPIGAAASIWLDGIALCATVGAVGMVVGLVAARAVRMVGEPGVRTPLGFLRALTVVAVYYPARALALVTRSPHHRR